MSNCDGCSSDTFSSALSYALELLGTPNLTLNEEQRKTKEIQFPKSADE